MEDFDRYYNRALWYLQIRMRSEHEMASYLRKKKANEETILRIIDRLKQNRFLNDFEFARQFIESRLRSRPRSFSVLAIELRKKGIAKDVVEKALPAKDDRTKSDEASARDLVRRKFSRYKSLQKKEQFAKLAGLLSRRGYSWDIISPVVDDVLRDGV